MERVSSLRDGERWEQVGVAVATKGATGAAVGLGLAVLLFGKMRTRSACMSICTGAGVGHGVTLGKSSFEDARAHLPAQLSQGWSDSYHSSQRNARLFVRTPNPIARSSHTRPRLCVYIATTTEEVWDRGVVNGIKKTGFGLLGGGLLALLVPSPVRMACLTGGAGVGLG